MALLVLDKSAVVAVKKGFLREYRSRHEFLLTDTLLYEIATEKLDERERMPSPEREKLEQRIAPTFGKAREAGEEWVDRNEALSHEITQGASARSARKLVMRDEFTTESMLDASRSVTQECLAHDEAMGRIASVKHASQDEQQFQRVRGGDEESVFTWLTDHFSSESVLRDVSDDARTGFTEVGTAHELCISPKFSPDRDWLCYGVTLIFRAYLPWKFWKVGDAACDPKKPANPFFDNLYIAFMAIADGVLSADKNLLKLAWACWPEKRENMFEYDMDEKQMKHFRPPWDKSAQ